MNAVKVKADNEAEEQPPTKENEEKPVTIKKEGKMEHLLDIIQS